MRHDHPVGQVPGRHPPGSARSERGTHSHRAPHPAPGTHPTASATATNSDHHPDPTPRSGTPTGGGMSDGKISTSATLRRSRTWSASFWMVVGETPRLARSQRRVNSSREASPSRFVMSGIQESAVPGHPMPVVPRNLDGATPPARKVWRIPASAGLRGNRPRVARVQRCDDRPPGCRVGGVCGR